MTRRLGFWLVGWSVGLAPLAGCAHWAGGSGASGTSAAKLLAFWDKKPHGQNTSIDADACAPPEVNAHETRALASRVAEGPGHLAGKVLRDQPPAIPEQQAPPIVPVAGADSPKDAPPAYLPPAGAPPPLAHQPPAVPSGINPPAHLKIEADATTPLTQIKPAVEQQKFEPLTLAVQCLIDNKAAEALAHLRHYPQPTQEVFLRLLPFLALMTHKSIDELSPEEVAILYEHCQGIVQGLRPRSKLAIDKACFCESIKSYGIYKPLAEGHAFVGSTPNRPGELVQLYVELRNFLSEHKNGMFATRLSSAVEIRDQKNERVWFYRFEDGKQPIRSRTQLHDYFNNYSFYVPHNLPAGTYSLTIQVTDETRPDQPRTASKSLEFRVTAVAARVP